MTASGTFLLSASGKNGAGAAGNVNIYSKNIILFLY